MGNQVSFANMSKLDETKDNVSRCLENCTKQLATLVMANTGIYTSIKDSVHNPYETYV